MVEPKRDALPVFRAVEAQLKWADRIIVSTDADREGEMIAREVLEYCKCRAPVMRLWLSALDPESIQRALSNLLDGRVKEPLYFAAKARAGADWLVGMNMTRALTVRCGREREVINIGRVQTPTFALVVRRDREIAGFRPRDYYDLVADVHTEVGAVRLAYQPKDEARMYDRALADRLSGEALGYEGPLSVKVERKKTLPPALYSLSGLQKVCNAKWGWSAEQTLNVAQSLYEKYKATTYPRTDCVFLPQEQAADARQIAAQVISSFELDVELPQPVIRKSVFNTAKITAHHAIIPTKLAVDWRRMGKEEAMAYRLICFAYLAALMPEYEYEQTQVRMDVPCPESVVFSAIGNVPKVAGWKALYSSKDDAEGEEDESSVFPPVRDGMMAKVNDVAVKAKQTKPPSYYTEGTLIADMEGIGKYVVAPSLRKRLKDTAGIGTEATRASILAGLRRNDFLVPKGKYIRATEKAHRVYDVLDAHLPSLIDPGETAVWEEQLEAIAKGELEGETFLNEIRGRIVDYLRELGQVPESVQRVDTGLKSWHPEHSDKAITESDARWNVPGMGELGKVLSGRSMSLDDYRAVYESAEPVAFEGFTSSKTGRKFNASLVWRDDKVSFVFDKTPVDESATGYSVRGAALVDCGDYYALKGVQARFYKVLAGRTMGVEEYKDLLEAKQGTGIYYDGFRSKKGSEFGAYLVWKPRAKPFPKVDMVFG